MENAVAGENSIIQIGEGEALVGNVLLQQVGTKMAVGSAYLGNASGVRIGPISQTEVFADAKNP